MARLDSKIEAYLGRKVDFTPIDGEIHLQDDGSGAYIATWNAPEPQPTQAQLDAVDADANSAEALAIIHGNRKAEYPSLNDLIVALWENVVEERASAVISLEADRQAVKTKYPKP